MVLSSGGLVMPQWTDEYTESDFNFSNSSGQQDYSPTNQSATEMQQWQLQDNSDSMNADPTSILVDSPSCASNASVSGIRTASTTASSPAELKNKGFCPFVAGLTQECVPQYCGPDAPCLQGQAVSGIPEVPEIEECDMAAYNSNPSEENSPQKSQLFKESESQQDRRQKRTSTGGTVAAAAGGPATSRGRQAHSLVERKYRENLNSKIDELHDAIQAIQLSRKDGSRSGVQGPPALGSGGRARKSDILAEALSYIYQSQVDMRHMADEISRLKSQSKPAEKPVNKCDDCALKKQVMRLRLLADGGE